MHVLTLAASTRRCSRVGQAGTDQAASRGVDRTPSLQAKDQGERQVDPLHLRAARTPTGSASRFRSTVASFARGGSAARAERMPAR